ncbi:hypothetical protein FIBSPDRAFT_156631 [Athelia psychrophila]|uniref:F-box domain-containing protein n=1 Tax=Athelia psychrophila TaxID=1759441 RepID=A0A166BCY8_9AGAM|nr:hypothetical protein FIBSPDRAFT_156631 [Fibularhizoctonia sp. CBS 109695]
MRAMANLTSLVLEQPRLSGRPIRRKLLVATYFLGCSFLLKTFRCTFRWQDSELSPFIHEQSQIEDLEIARCCDLTPPLGSAPASFLPNLSVVDIGYHPPGHISLLAVAALRPLTRLRVCVFAAFSVDVIADIINALAPAEATLTHLDLDCDHSFDSSTSPGENYFVEALEIIARGLPRLKFLRFSKYIALDPNPLGMARSPSSTVRIQMS